MDRNDCSNISCGLHYEVPDYVTPRRLAHVCNVAYLSVAHMHPVYISPFLSDILSFRVINIIQSWTVPQNENHEQTAHAIVFSER